MKEGLIAGIARQRNGEKKEGKMEREREKQRGKKRLEKSNAVSNN